jgi:signal transduction histidine kinase
MPNQKFHTRLQALFTDIEHLAAQPDADGLDVRRELEMLRARVLELETQFSESEKLTSTPESVSPANPDAPASARQPILYEKEQVGYAFNGSKLESMPGSNFTGLDVTNAILTPLTETGKSVGAMFIEPDPQHPWSPEDKNWADAVAQQASLQIQNLRLLAAAERARAEAQAATRRFTHESWDTYLDAIHQNERIGYAYDLNADIDYQEAVNVLDEQVGSMFLKTSQAQPLTKEDRALVAAVAYQVGQQVENLRLLADASRARADAEEATRRLTRDSWKEYAARKEDSMLGFVYDSNQVTPLTEAPLNISFSQPLIVRGEAIGELAVAGLENISPETAELLAAIAAQASIHLETLRLTEELQKRAAELQELDRLKSSFLANMSHELRTPLNSILGFSDVMLEEIDGPLTDYMQNDLRLIQKNGKHLLHLINDVLDMAKIESGRMNLHPEKFKVHEVLDEVASITSTFASEKNLGLFIEPNSDNEIEILADVTRLRQVVINLVNNSIKFTEKGKVTMRVDPLGDSQILITVKDTGIGIPPDQLEKVFQEFSQVDSSSTRKVGGTGLGLPISRRLVEMHGGRMWAESTGISGEGSIFYVELPREAKFTEPVEKTVK